MIRPDSIPDLTVVENLSLITISILSVAVALLIVVCLQLRSVGRTLRDLVAVINIGNTINQAANPPKSDPRVAMRDL